MPAARQPIGPGRRRGRHENVGACVSTLFACWTRLDAAAVRRWCGGGLAALRAHQREIDELNVYPVPDGDTGTNLVLTLTSAAEALDGDLDAGRRAGRPRWAGRCAGWPAARCSAPGATPA